ncbi:MAG: PIN domain-containing protein [Trueperaceae bacterium]
MNERPREEQRATPHRRTVAGPTALIVRVVLSGGLAGLGVVLAEAMLARNLLVGPNNVLYLGLLGALSGWLLSRPAGAIAERWISLAARRVGSVSPEAVLAAGTGALLALVLTVLLNNVLAAVPGFTWYWSLLIAGLLIGASAAFFVTNRHLLPFVQDDAEAAPSGAGRTKLVDTSAIIDGRMVEVADAHFLDGRLLIPAFVLGELQRIADDADPLRRKRGRRGLEVLERLSELTIVETQVVHDDVPDAKEVDEKLVRLAQRKGADLITTDFNLHQVAQLQGVRVLNLHRLANAVKASVLPGETLSLSVVRTGREPGQGLAYLEDGTMVVIEDAAARVGESVDAVVTSSLQTNMGRMIFAKLDGASGPSGT